MVDSAPLDLKNFRAAIFDTDGVITRTAVVHATAWKRLFDEFLQTRAAQQGTPFQPFDAESDYRLYVDGKPRYDGVQSFLESRGVDLPLGTSADPPGMDTMSALGNRKDDFFLASVERDGVLPYESTVELIHDLKRHGIRTAVISASRNCAIVLQSSGTDGLFEVKVDGIDSERLGIAGKPDPAIFLEAAKELGVTPQEAIVVEDALAGVDAGHRGDFGLVIGVNRANLGDEMTKLGADIVVPDLSAIRLA